MTDLTRDLVQAVNIHYSSNNNDCKKYLYIKYENSFIYSDESGSESDVQDQQPTEATDDSK
jgi:hypothetical protein